VIELLESPAVRRQVAPLSVQSYHKLRDLGLVPVKTELLNGLIVRKMTKSPLHTLLAHRLYDRLSCGLPPGYQLRKEDPLTLSTSEPEPDIAIVTGDIETYRDHHPSTGRLVAEIAVSSIDVDRAKADLYAEAGIPTYWLVLAEKGEVEAFSQPSPTGYREAVTRRRGDTLETWYGARIPLDELFG
jgi:Uma2 family endonuclease